MIEMKPRIIALFVLSALGVPVYAGNIQYTATDLGVSGPDSYAMGVNDLGQVCGYADTYTNYSHAFLYTGTGPLVNLGSFGGDYSVSKADSIN